MVGISYKQTNAKVLESGLKIAIKHRGAYAEHLAIIWLVKEGYEVFRNISPHGACDIVAFKNDFSEKILIDVKTTTVYRTADKKLKICVIKPKAHQVKCGIRILGVSFYGDHHFVVWGDDLEAQKKISDKINDLVERKA